MTLHSPLLVARYRFTSRARGDFVLPGYAGPMLRSVFGAALRHLACMTKLPQCGGCPLVSTCPHTRIFEAQAVPGSGANPYVIEPPAMDSPMLVPGSMLTFHMILIGHAIEQLPLIILAWQRGLARGLTRGHVGSRTGLDQREHAAFDLETVDWVQADGMAVPVWQARAPSVAQHQARLLVPTLAKCGHEVTLHLQTPLRLQSPQGQVLDALTVTPPAFISSLTRRVAQLLDGAGRMEAGAASTGDVASAQTEAIRQVSTHSRALVTDQEPTQLRWFDYARYSSRQRQQMPISGVLGHWTWRGPASAIAAVWPWLWLGQWLHAGKSTVMGLGGYSLTGATLAD